MSIAGDRKTSLLTPDDLVRCLRGLKTLQEQTGALLAHYGTAPALESLAEREFETFASTELLRTAYAQGDLLIQVSAEQLSSVVRALAEPLLPIAVWTSTRSLLESAALGSWLFEPSIGARGWVGRSFAFRFSGLTQQIRLARLTGDVVHAERVSKRREHISKDANELGYPPIKDRRGRTIGIGVAMPPISELAGRCLGAETDYRLMSAMVHAHPWAVQQVAYEINETDSTDPGFRADSSPRLFEGKKAAKPEALIYLVVRSAKFFAEPLRRKVALYGWDRERFDGLLNRIVEDHIWWRSSDGRKITPVNWISDSPVLNVADRQVTG